MRASRESRATRLAERAEKASLESTQAYTQAKAMAEAIPLGQPILIGHHSEKGDRAYRAKYNRRHEKSFELLKKSEELERRAEASANNTAIYADALDPVAELDARLAALQARREAIKARPHQSFELSNLGANIRRLEKRREQLAAMKASARCERMVGLVKVVEDPEIARIQLFFPGKPDEATRGKLKSAGFRWAPSEGAWQRQLNNSGRYAAAQVLKDIAE